MLSAILKYHATERMRTALNDALDIHGGRAICDGPRNYLFGAYMSVPVAITVEGANILTRSLIIFGQGAIRCHPYLLKEMEAANLPDPNEALQAFDKALWAHIGTRDVERAARLLAQSDVRHVRIDAERRRMRADVSRPAHGGGHLRARSPIW